MVEWVRRGIATMRSDVQVAAGVYLKEAGKTIGEGVPIADIVGQRDTVDGAILVLEAAHGTWRKTAGSEIKKVLA